MSTTSTDRWPASALEEVELPPLLAALAAATGDRSLVDGELALDPAVRMLPQGGLSPAQLHTGRQRAAAALARLLDDRSPQPPVPVADLVRYLTGEAAAAEVSLPLFEEELAVGGIDPRAPGWHRDQLDAVRPFSVAVIGAGMSGLLVAHRLRQAGIEVTVLEKNADLGGTWHDNTYPGCRVDVHNHLYSYSFDQRDDWPHHFSTQDVLLDYFRSFAERSGVMAHVRFGTDVRSATFDDDTMRWTLELRTPKGDSTVEVDAVISAVGQLNRPKMPAIEGRDRFAGPSWHSARWDHGVDLRGKRVAVIGTGASALQFVPAISGEVADLVVYQRTPPWLGSTPDYHDDVSAGLQWLLDHVDDLGRWYRVWRLWQTFDGTANATVDPAWPASERSVSAANDRVRQAMTAYLEDQFGDRPDLLAKVVPSYPPSAKRGLRDNGAWARTLKLDHVHLVTDPLREITPTGVVTADGVERPADVIIYGTGFEASKFLTPMQVRGRGGVDLHQRWQGDARAYLGMTVPGFPNFFVMYGPNTNLVVHGSITFFSECQSRYILGCVRLLLEGNWRSIECRSDVHDAFNAWVDEANRSMAWGASSVSSWYKNELGRVAQNWPTTLQEYWTRTLSPNRSDFALGR